MSKYGLWKTHLLVLLARLPSAMPANHPPADLPDLGRVGPLPDRASLTAPEGIARQPRRTLKNGDCLRAQRVPSRFKKAVPANTITDHPVRQ